ncbi:hypothetical protein ACVWU4_000977 [Campylobacter coli]
MYRILGTDIYVQVSDEETRLFLNKEEIEYNGEITIYGKKYKKPLYWIRNIALYNFRFLKTDHEFIENLLFVPFRSKSKHYKHINTLPVLAKPITKTINNIVYRRIARFPDYYVSKNGNILNASIGFKHMPIIYNNHWKYPICAVLDPVWGNKAHATVHKLVALAWIDNDDYYNKNIVDHKDRDKLNYNAYNLQWISEGHNQAREKYDDKPAFQIRNIDTGEVIDFISQWDFFRWNNGKKVNFGNNFKLMFYGKIWNLKGQRYEIKAYNDKRDWWYKNNTEPPKELANKFGKNIQAKNLSTGEVIEGSVYDLVKLTSLSRSGIYKKIYLKDEVTEVSGWLIRVKSDKPWAEEHEIKYSTNKPVVTYVEDTVDNTVTEYSSNCQAAKAIDVSERTIAKYKDTNIPYSYKQHIYKFWSTYTGNSVSVSR